MLQSTLETFFHVETSKSINSRSRSNFSSAFFFLPREKRLAIRRVYAFFRVIDDIVDESSDTEKQKKLIGSWKTALHEMYAGRPAIPLLVELGESTARFGIPMEYFAGLIEGCEMDLVKKRYLTFGELYEYCYRVASMVGLVCMKIFEHESPSSEESAVNLGIALQLTNIIRDVGVDLEKGRIYIPGEDLARFHVSEQDLREGKTNQPFMQLMNCQYERALDYYKKGFMEFEKGGRRLLAARIMGMVYLKILKKIQKKDYPVFSERVHLNFAEKLCVLANALCFFNLQRKQPV